jgi:pyruvate/2-oxoglutarate dehydrogenase complex dihydrolipoamide acyltransferase (E2) component
MLGFKKNVPEITPIKLSPWRKISLSTWKIVDDSSVHGLLKLNADKVLEYIDQNSDITKITLTHFMIKALAQTIKENPEANSFIRFGRLYQRKNVDIFVHIAADDDGKELTGTVIRNADKKSIIDIANELNDVAHKYKSGQESEFDNIKGLLKILPPFILRPILLLTGFILYSLNIWSPLLGMQRDPFAGIMLTNVGSLGVDLAYTPLARYSRVSFLIALGSLQDGLKLDDGNVVKTKELNITSTFDHRIIDGVHAAKISKMLRSIFENPSQLQMGK